MKLNWMQIMPVEPTSTVVDTDLIVMITVAMVGLLLSYNFVKKLRRTSFKKTNKQFVDRRMPFVEELGIKNEFQTGKM